MIRSQIVAGGQKFLRDPGNREYASTLKFTPATSTAPVILICGQTAVTNRAAINYLKHNYREVAKVIGSVTRFCIIIRVAASDTYGYQAASLERDVLDDAFSSRHPIASPRRNE